MSRIPLFFFGDSSMALQQQLTVIAHYNNK